MGLLSTIKGWLNIGGVKILLWKYTEPLSRTDLVIEGAVLFKSKSDKTVTSLEVKVVEEITTTDGEGEDKTTEKETNILGTVKFPIHDPGLGYPLEVKAGVNQEQTFSLNVALTSHLQEYSVPTTKLGKLAALASKDSEKVEYYIVASAAIKGATFSTEDKHLLKIGD